MIDSSSMQRDETSIGGTILIAGVCSLTKQVSVCTILIAVVCSMMKQVSLCT